MATREYNFIVGPETSTLPAIGTPSSSTDLITLGYADAHYTQGKASVADVAAVKAIGSSDRADGMLIVVQATNTAYIFDAGNAGSGDDNNIITPTAGTGRWLKVRENQLTASRAMVSDANGYVSASATTSTEIGYISGLSSAVQTQLNAKVDEIASTDNVLPKFDGTGGSIQTTGITVDDSNNVTGVNDLTVTGNLTVNGTTTSISTTNTDVEDKLITINKGGAVTSGDGAGLEVEENSVITGYAKVSAARTGWEFKSPASAGISTLTTGASSDTIALIATAQDLSNKTFTDAPQLTEIATPATPAAGKYKIYPKSDKYLYTLNSDGTETKVGAGTGGINYIASNDGEATTGWTTFNDATSYADGTGGSPSATWTASASSPLRGTKSFLWTAGTAGDGVSYAFTIDSADKAKLLQIKFDYEVVTFASMTDNDYEIWIYDVTNAVAIQPTAYQLKNSSLPANGFCNFQSASNSTSYRLSIFQKDGTTSNIRFDNISVGPQVTVQGAAVSDWVSYTPTLTNLTATGTNASNTGKWRRVGDSMEGVITVRTGSTGDGTNASPITFGIPSGYSIDTSKLPTGAAGSDNALGHGTWYDRSAVLLKTVDVRKSTVTELFISIDGASGASAVLGSDIGTDQDDDFSFRFTVPILGWSSNTSFAAESGDGRVVAARLDSAGLINTALTAATDYGVVFPTVTFDTHGMSSNISTAAVTTTLANASGLTVPSSGYYLINWYAYLNTFGGGSGYVDLKLLKNNSIHETQTFIFSVQTEAGFTFTTELYLAAGDKIGFAIQNETVSTSKIRICKASISKLQGPSAIAASETVAVNYSDEAGTTITNANTAAFATKIIDTHGAMSGGIFTAPISGLYSFCYSLRSNAAWLTSEAIGYIVYKNDVTIISNNPIYGNGTTQAISIETVGLYSLLAGDTLRAKYSTSHSGAVTLGGNTTRCTIVRVGNY